MRVLSGIGKTIKWALILFALLIVILVIAAIVSLGNAGNQSDQSSKQVSAADYKQIHAGMTKSAVRALVGKPESTTTTSVQGLTEDCWEYGVLSSSGTFQFCFANGKLDSKMRL